MAPDDQVPAVSAELDARELAEGEPPSDDPVQVERPIGEIAVSRGAAPGSWRKWLSRLLPWVAAGIAAVAILAKYPPSRIAAEMNKGDLLAMTPYGAALIAVGVFILSSSDFAMVRGLAASPELAKPSYLKVIRARAGMSLLGLIGYGAGVGGLGVWIARVTGCSVALASGAVLYLMSADLIAVSMVTSLSVWLGGLDVASTLRIGAPVLVVVLLALKLGVLDGLVDRSAVPTVLKPWALISRGRALSIVGLRTVNIGWLTLCSWGGAQAFGMDVPLWAWMAIFPVVLLVGSMPINVAGFGAVQGAWLLFEPWARSGEQVLAFSLLWQLVCLVGVVVRGVPFVGSVFGEIARGRRATG